MRCGMLPSTQLIAISVAKQSRLGTGFPDGCRGGGEGESNLATGFFRWPGCCLDWLLRRFSCACCPMLSSCVNLSLNVLPSPADSCLENKLISSSVLRFRSGSSRWSCPPSNKRGFTIVCGRIPMKILLVDLWKLCRGKRDGVAQLLQAANMVSLETCTVHLVKVISSQISIRLVGLQEVIDDHQ